MRYASSRIEVVQSLLCESQKYGLSFGFGCNRARGKPRPAAPLSLGDLIDQSQSFRINARGND